MCNFCKKIYTLSKGGLPNENCLAYDDELKQIDIWTYTGDPYDCGVVEKVRYCPYCGEKLNAKGVKDDRRRI